jgi:hypothetical protein
MGFFVLFVLTVVGQYIWQRFHPPAFNVSVSDRIVEYEFRDRKVFEEFAKLNGITVDEHRPSGERFAAFFDALDRKRGSSDSDPRAGSDRSVGQVQTWDKVHSDDLGTVSSCNEDSNRQTASRDQHKASSNVMPAPTPRRWSEALLSCSARDDARPATFGDVEFPVLCRSLNGLMGASPSEWLFCSCDMGDEGDYEGMELIDASGHLYEIVRVSLIPRPESSWRRSVIARLRQLLVRIRLPADAKITESRHVGQLTLADVRRAARESLCSMVERGYGGRASYSKGRLLDSRIESAGTIREVVLCLFD